MRNAHPRRAAQETPGRTIVDVLARVRAGVVDVALWTLGGLGLLSILAAVAAHLWGFSIVLFSTGSMTPTIPAGSAALVRLLPAADFHIGDIATVERQNLLPVTHRITSIKPLEGSPSARVITMRGDANDQDDPEPYVVTKARLVIASVPGVAQIVSATRNPLLMLVLTLLAGGLVTWAFWPRQARKASVVAAAAIFAGSSLLGSSEAQAAETEHEVVGRHMVLTVIADDEAMSSMVPGLPVLWQVGVATRADEEGALHIGLGLAPGTVAADALTVEVLACPERWQGQTCGGAVQTWVSATSLARAFLPLTHDDAREVGGTAAGTPVWILVRVTMARSVRDVSATLKITAWGGGEMVSAESDGGGTGQGALARTGADGTAETVVLAGAAIVSGLAIAWLAGRRRRASDREVAR